MAKEHVPTMREIGKKGGNRVKEKYGMEYYQRLGRMGQEARRQQREEKERGDGNNS